MEKPVDLDGYKKWLEEEHDTKVSRQTDQYYQTVVEKIERQLTMSEIWRSTLDQLSEFDGEYRTLHNNYALLSASKEPPELSTKPFQSFFEKTFRKNVLNNSNWEKAPDGGWILPSNWFEQINDIVRTSIVVKYLDGVTFLSNKIIGLSHQMDCECEVDYEAKEEGYYASHIYIYQEYEIPLEGWNTKKIVAPFEIQVRTQVQDVIRRLLHEYYERARLGKVEKPEQIWQWDYKSDEFAANYLGHIIQYIEGLIVDIRDKQSERLS